MLKRVALMTPVMALSAFGCYVWRTSTGGPFELARSEILTVLAVGQWFNVLNCRSELKSALNFSIFKNYGSGVIEARGKTVAGKRLKQSGMFWSEPGASSVLQFRTILLSGRFDALWTDRKNQAAAKNDALAFDA